MSLILAAYIQASCLDYRKAFLAQDTDREVRVSLELERVTGEASVVETCEAHWDLGGGK